MTRRVLLVAAVMAVFGLGGVAGALGWQWWRDNGVAGTQRPAFALPDLDGNQRSITEWDGDIIVLNFWATWCKPCRAEIPLFVELQQRFRDRGVQFVGVAIDQRQAAAQFAKDFEMNYPSFHGIENAMDVQSMYGNDAGTLPYTVVIDRNGTVRHVFRKVIEDGELAPILASMASST